MCSTSNFNWWILKDHNSNIYLSHSVHIYLSISVCLYLSIYLYIYIFQAVAIWVLLYGYSIWILTKCHKKKLDGNYTRVLHADSKKFWKHHPTKQQLYSHLPPISQTIQVRHVGHRRIKDEIISDILLWSPTHGHTSVGQPAKIYIDQLCEDTACYREKWLKVTANKNRWRESKRIHAISIIC